MSSINSYLHKPLNYRLPGDKMYGDGKNVDVAMSSPSPVDRRHPSVAD